MILPDWLTADTRPPGSGGRPKRKAAVALGRRARALASEFQADTGAAGFLHQMDARTKLAGLALILVILLWVREPLVILAVYLFVLGLAVATGLGMRGFLKRTLISAAVFALPFALPIMLNVVTPGREVIDLFDLPVWLKIGGLSNGGRLALTASGLRAAFILFTRALAMLSLTMLVASTTPAHRLIAALSAARLPCLVVISLQLAHRYVLILARLVDQVHLAKTSRAIRSGSSRDERHWAARRLGWIFQRSIALSDQTTMSMISRGWRGDYTGLPMPALKRRDWLALCCLAAGAIFLAALA